MAEIQKARVANKPMPDLPSLPQLLKDNWGLDVVTLKILDSYDDANFFLVGRNGEGESRFLVKFYNAIESGNPEFLRGLSGALERLAHPPLAPVLIPRILKPLASKKDNADDFIVVSCHTVKGDTVSCAVRVFHWISGETLNSHAAAVHWTHFVHVGDAIGRLQDTLHGYDHPALHRQHLWDLRQFSLAASDLVGFVPDPRLQQLIQTVYRTYQSDIPTEAFQFSLKEPWLPWSVIMGDANDANLIVDPATCHIAGIIDFSDTMTTWRVNELAIALAYGAVTPFPNVPSAVVLASLFLGYLGLDDAVAAAGAPGDSGCSSEHKHEHGHEHKHEHGHEHKHEHGHEHKHEHGHEHKHEHGHEHKHEHGHEHKHEHGHEHKHEHGHEHKHEHGHEHKHEHGHEHKHEHGHEHKHEHDHDHSHGHGHAQKGDHECCGGHDHEHAVAAGDGSAAHDHAHEHGHEAAHSHKRKHSELAGDAHDAHHTNDAHRVAHASSASAASEPAGAAASAATAARARRHLTDRELSLLPLLIAVRLSTSVMVGAFSIAQSPENADYLQLHATPGRRALAAWCLGAATDAATDDVAAAMRRRFAQHATFFRRLYDAAARDEWPSLAPDDADAALATKKRRWSWWTAPGDAAAARAERHAQVLALVADVYGAEA
eukprot:gene11078-7883_t